MLVYDAILSETTEEDALDYARGYDLVEKIS
jgi:hypothetical protein